MEKDQSQGATLRVDEVQVQRFLQQASNRLPSNEDTLKIFGLFSEEIYRNSKNQTRDARNTFARRCRTLASEI